MSQKNRYLLSGRARNATLENRVEEFHLDDFGAAERGELREPDLDEKMGRILAWFQQRSNGFGEILLQVSEIDYPVGYCRDPREWMARGHEAAGESAARVRRWRLRGDGSQRLGRDSGEVPEARPL